MADWIDRISGKLASGEKVSKREVARLTLNASVPGGTMMDDLARAVAGPMHRRRMLGLTAGAIALTQVGFPRSAKAAFPYSDCRGGGACGASDPQCNEDAVCSNFTNGCTEACGFGRDNQPTANAYGCCAPSDVCCPAPTNLPGAAGGYCCSAGARCCSGFETVDCCGPSQVCTARGRCIDCTQTAVCGDFCCRSDQTCVDGQCLNNCPTGSTRCGSTCCSSGQACENGQCVPVCPSGRVRCGSICCAPGEICADGTCKSPDNCPSDRVCGSACCDAPGQCHNGVCCPTGRRCGSACCAENQFCCNESSGICCNADQLCCNQGTSGFCRARTTCEAV